MFTRRRDVMGELVNRRRTQPCWPSGRHRYHRANVYLLYQTFFGGVSMFKHLLVPLDGSALAELALPAAAYLARLLPARVTLLHLV